MLSQDSIASEPSAPLRSLQSVCQISTHTDGIITFLFDHLDELFLYSIDDLEHYMLSHVGDLSNPLRLIYDFRQVHRIPHNALSVMKPIFGMLSNHHHTRSAYIAGTREHYHDLYTAYKLRNGTHLGDVEIFLSNEAAMRRWLRDS